MITVTCDMCGKKIPTHVDLVDVNFEYNGMRLGEFRTKQRNLCITCATRLVNWVDAQLEKGGAE